MPHLLLPIQHVEEDSGGDGVSFSIRISFRAMLLLGVAFHLITVPIAVGLELANAGKWPWLW